MIEINNLTTNLVDENFLKKVAQKVLKEEGKSETDLSIALIGQGRIRELNRRYRGKNRATDVLAFGQGSAFAKEKSRFILPSSKELGLGEIVICLREVKKNTKRFGSTFEKELATCLIHGILHLLGYDHEKDEVAAKKMEDKQQYYLSKMPNTLY